MLSGDVYIDPTPDPDYGPYEQAREYARSQRCSEQEAEAFAAYYLEHRDLAPAFTIPRLPPPWLSS